MAHVPSSLPQLHTRVRLLTLAAVLVGFALRLYRLGAASLWYDETVSVALAQKSIPDLLRHTAGDIHPPGYYLLLHCWQALTQPTPAFGLEFLYAWPSLCCGLLIMTLLFAIGRALFSPHLALLALWLAAINPYHIWYSQEVRMYTFGALLGLLCLWAVWQWWRPTASSVQPIAPLLPTLDTKASGGFKQDKPPFIATRIKHRELVLYITAGAAGLYTLYYFLFVLIALNWIALLLWWQQRHQGVRHALGRWVGAQVAIALLWAPWLPIFWRQATDPPVPPWRMPWTSGTEFIASSAESASALLSGQSAPLATAWPWLPLLFAIFLCAYLYVRKDNRPSILSSYGQISSYLLIPMLAIYAITLWVTPLYHVRYLFTYAPPLLLLVAAALLAIARWRRLLGLVALSSFIALNGWSLYTFWFTPALQTDDHRAAVAQVAQAWRPSDVIVVNAGWVYTALTTYWPTDLVGVDAAAPPPLGPIVRLLDDPAQQAANITNMATGLVTVPVVRTGSVDGAPGLGWGDPASDFFAISAAATHQTLFNLARAYRRLWHYRLYDTVSDPQGVIRTWLDTYNTMLAETPIPGRDYLRVQLYQSAQAPTAPRQLVPLTLAQQRFQGDLRIQQAALTAEAVPAGAYLYAYLQWQPPVTRTDLPAVVSFSLRLYDKAGHLLAQADETPPLPLAAWATGYAFTLALPVPVATPPGAHQLVLVAYDQQTGEPLAVAESEPPRHDLPLGAVQVTPATQAPIVTAVEASFDYIDLVRARLTTPTSTPGASLTVELVWRPRENAYRDTYLGQVVLQNEVGVVVGQWEAALGGWDYPSGGWPPLIPVRDWRSFPLDPAITPGRYTLILRVRRASDQQIIPARLHWWSRGDESVILGTVAIE